MSESQSVVVLLAFECLQFSGNFSVPFVLKATFLISTNVARTQVNKTMHRLPDNPVQTRFE